LSTNVDATLVVNLRGLFSVTEDANRLLPPLRPKLFKLPKGATALLPALPTGATNAGVAEDEDSDDDDSTSSDDDDDDDDETRQKKKKKKRKVSLPFGPNCTYFTRFKGPAVKNYYTPTDDDVLLGRAPKHPGNVRYLNLRDDFQRQYLKPDTTHDQKADIAKQYVDAVHGWGGKFLMPEMKKGGENEDDVVWYEITDRQAREKCRRVLVDIRHGRLQLDSRPPKEAR